MIYIAGPMTGYKDYNYPKFFEIDEKLVNLGWKTVNPARVADSLGGQDAFLADKNTEIAILKEQKSQLMKCDAIVLLDGWTKSPGSRIELKLALENNLDVYLEHDIC